MIAKAGLGLIGLSAISVGGVALTKPYWLGMADPMPEYHTLDKDNGYDTTYSGDDKFGKKYGKYLTGVTTEKGANGQGGKTHEDWWNWALRRLNREKTPSGKFSNINEWYKSNGSTALNQVCKAAYETEDKNDNFDESGANGTKFKKSDVWKYCSIGGTQPQTIQEFNTSNSTNQETYSASEAIGGNSSDQKSKLLSIKSTANQWIWDLKDKEFGSTNITEESYFKSEKDKTGTERKTIKDICKGAYEKKENSSTGKDKLEKTDVVKYCSLEGK